MLVFCRFAALRTDTVRQLQEVHRMKKRTRRRRPARHFHPLGIVLLAAVTMDTLQTRAAANAAKKVTGQAPAETKEEAAK